MPKPLQVIGLCRFSYPSKPDAFSRTFQNLDALRGYLYDDERLEKRFDFFENIALPGLRAQTDPDFLIVVLAGDQLPQRFRDRLERSVEDIPQINIAYMPEGEVHREVCRVVMTGMRDPDSGPVAEFRLDDDDAVAVDFVQKTREIFSKIAPLFHANKRVCLDFCKGILLSVETEDVRGKLTTERMWTPGQVIFRKPTDPLSLLSANHMHLWQTMTTVSWPNQPMFVRSAHGDNDSHLMDRYKGENRLQQIDVELVSLLKERFDIDLPTLSLALTGRDISTS